MYINSQINRKEYFMIDSQGMFGINLFLCKKERYRMIVTTIIIAMAAPLSLEYAAIAVSVLYRMLTYLL